MDRTIRRLTGAGIQPTPQRIAVAEYVLKTTNHPTADEVWMNVRGRCPTLSRATVYNTLHLFSEKGLLRTLSLKEGVSVFDPHVAPHHHFIDDDTGKVTDIPWDAVTVTGEKSLRGLEVREYQVVLRGRKRM
jgi:Fur family iron response transcriptional regulator